MIDLDKSRLLRSGPRLIQILRVLIRHGFLRALRGKNHWPSPQEVRETFEELGLTFLKLGQVLAMRRDLLPDAYIDELEKLQDRLTPLDFDVVRAIVESEFSAPLTDVFLSFSETPLASATIAQVHEANTLDGRHVAVKVQRSGLAKIISTDIAALTHLVTLAEGIAPRLRAIDLPLMVEEFANSLNRETNFCHEADSIRIMRTALAETPNLWIPNVVTECSGKTVLTLEFCDCQRIDVYAKLHPEAVSQLIDTLVRIMLQSILQDGLFHADPHPGNVLVSCDGRLSLLDFGMMGELDEHMRKSLTLLLDAVVKGDARAVTEAYLEMATGSETVNRAGLIFDIKSVLYEIRRSNLADISIGDAFALLLRAGSRHGVRNPSDFFHLTRAFVIMESMIRILTPSYDYISAFREEIARLISNQFALDRIKNKTSKFVFELDRLLVSAPSDTRRVLQRIAEGNLGRVQAPALEALGGSATRYLKLLHSAIISAALMVAGGLLVAAPKDAGWHHNAGELMVSAGIFSTAFHYIKGFRRQRGRR